MMTNTNNTAAAPVTRFGMWSEIGGRSCAVYFQTSGGPASSAVTTARSLGARDLNATVFLAVRRDGEDVWVRSFSGEEVERLGFDGLSAAMNAA